MKTLTEIMGPDPIWRLVSSIDQSRWMQQVNCLAISSKAPEEVRSSFVTVQNLMVYAWFVFDFLSVAEMKISSTLEAALRSKFQADEKTTFKGFLDNAINKNYFDPSRLPTWKKVQVSRASLEVDFPIVPFTAEEWIKEVKTGLRKNRNRLAHGEESRYFQKSLWNIQFCADLINALYQEKEN